VTPPAAGRDAPPLASPAVPTLSEAASKQLLAGYGVPVLDERTVETADAAVDAAASIGYPVVVKLCGDAIAHKTERGLVRLALADSAAVLLASSELLAAARPEDGPVGLLVAPMVRGSRELIAGLVRDPQFGPCVMFGVGGVLAEALGDVAFRLVPLDELDAEELLDDLETQALLGPFRGEPAVDRGAVAATLAGLSRLAQDRPDVRAVDLNPLIVVDGKPVAVDALVEIDREMVTPRAVPAVRASDDAFRALFEPRGVIVAGASTHPGKFGFVALHNILSSGYPGRVGATNLEATPVLGVETVRTVDELPEGPWDLVFVCTPAGANTELLRACARRGVRAAFLTSAGYGEAGEAGVRAQAELVALAAELGILLAGPNGQGVVSTPAHLCAQIVAPYPPAGRIAIASQSGNFVSSFENWAVQTGVGVSRAVSAGNAAALGVADYLDWYADDDASAVSLAYVEGVEDGRALFDRLRSVARRKPVVLVKGGTTASGQRAAASHTGSLAADDRIFDGMCRQAGITRAATIEEAFEAAATFATQPRPSGPRTAVLTTAGGWGVVTADAIARAPGLELATLPDDLRAAIDEKLPPRWSRNNPIDFAGGETRDTIPEVMELVARHPAIDAVVYLGLGIQSNTARMLREGAFYPDHGIERIVAYHERQDARFAQAAADISDATGKPILTATELAVAAPDNPGPLTVRATGRLCYSSANRAVTALAHLWHDAQFRRSRKESS
jgi:acyl-CoA synthetase (NDP forming)